MTSVPSTARERPDPAAVFAAAISMYETYRDVTSDDFDLSELYGGMDEFMRVCMQCATKFEDWACQNVDFDALSDLWPYLLEDKFGPAVIGMFGHLKFQTLCDSDCHTLAKRLELPLSAERNQVTVPIDHTALPWVHDKGRRAIVSQSDWLTPPDHVKGVKGIPVTVISLWGMMHGKNHQADIDLIVQAVNMHGPMVTTLQEELQALAAWFNADPSTIEDVKDDILTRMAKIRYALCPMEYPRS